VSTLHSYITSTGVTNKLPKSLPDFQLAYPPRQNQVHDLRCLLKNNRWGLFSDAGVGKSLPMHALMLWHAALGNRTLVLLPPVLILQFMSDLHEVFTGSDKFISHENFSIPKPKRDKLLAKWMADGSWPDVLLMSTQMFTRYPQVFKAVPYDVVIVDEAQSLRGSESKIYSAVCDYTAKEAETALVLSTGTPVHNTPLDLYAMGSLLQRDEWLNISSFKRRFCVRDYSYVHVMKQTRRGPKSVRVQTEKIVDFKNLEVLNQIIYSRASRATKSEVLSLKDPTIVRQKVKMSTGHYRLYRKMLKERMLELDNGTLLTAELEVQLRQHLMKIAVAPHLFVEDGKKIDNQLMEALKAIIDGLGTEGKLIVFSTHNAAVETVAEAFPDLAPAIIYGGPRSSTAKNTEESERFKTDPACRLLSSNTQSGSVGMNYQKVCSTIAFYEPTTIPGDFTQALARAYRSGQTEVVVCYLIEAEKTAFPRMIDAMLGRGEMAAEVNGDKQSFIDYMLDGGKL